ncbi:hypothetical protein [Flavobacterium limi]|uniref:hypothetical protein n=1 Tax=Flavobacterium limi TaxID=2045105 RepID=UPI001E2AC00B|nr:hypothetical protein [Flavobacterium limi]
MLIESNGFVSEDGYEDGTYCAEIEYYYSETGTNSTYTLEVEIENNELTVIHWPNGGWLDSSHFIPPDISDGEASFTSDEGVDYTVKIIGNEGDCVTDSYAKDEDDLIREKEDQQNEEENRIREEEEKIEENKQQEEENHNREEEEEDNSEE